MGLAHRSQWIVLNRQNCLFVVGTRGGRTGAIRASLTSTCRRQAMIRSAP
jgi:hypothetical protein